MLRPWMNRRLQEKGLAMLRLQVLVALIASCTALNYTDCAYNADRAITVNVFSTKPSTTLVLPGQLRYSLDIDVTKDINDVYLFIDVKKKGAFGFINIPCNYGPLCSPIDLCRVNLTEAESQTHLGTMAAAVAMPFMRILQSAIRCPVVRQNGQMETWTCGSLQLKALPSSMASLVDGEYEIRITMKDTPTATAAPIGCIQFDVGLKRFHKTTGFLFN